jgi:hypothetical protein
VAQGHQNFVVGGAHGRYRDYGGTLVEVPEEVYAVRQAALTVLDPITYCWVSLSHYYYHHRHFISFVEGNGTVSTITRLPLSPPLRSATL